MSGKQIINNTAVQIVGRVISTLFTFVTTYLIIRISGTALYGDFTKILSILAISYTALDFGINAQVVRSYSNSSEKEKNIIFSNLLLLRLIIAVTLILASILIVNLLSRSPNSGYTPEIRFAFYLASISIVFQGVFTSANSVFQHSLNYAKSVIASSFGAIVFFIITSLVLISHPTLNKLIAANTLGYFTTAFVSILYVRKLITNNISLEGALKILKRSLLIGLVLIFSIISTKTDAIILGIFRSSGEVGEYALAYKIFDFALVIPVFAMNAVYPLMLNSLKEKNKAKSMIISTLKILIPLSVLGSVALYFMSPLVNLIRPDLSIAIQSLRILSLSLPLFYVSGPYMWLLIAHKQEKSLVFIYGIASIFNILSNLFYVPIYGAPSSAILTIITECIILTGLLIASKKYNYV